MSERRTTRVRGSVAVLREQTRVDVARSKEALLAVLDLNRLAARTSEREQFRLEVIAHAYDDASELWARWEAGPPYAKRADVRAAMGVMKSVAESYVGEGLLPPTLEPARTLHPHTCAICARPCTHPIAKVDVPCCIVCPACARQHLGFTDPRAARDLDYQGGWLTPRTRHMPPGIVLLRTPQRCEKHGAYEGQPRDDVYAAMCPKCDAHPDNPLLTLTPPGPPGEPSVMAKVPGAYSEREPSVMAKVPGAYSETMHIAPDLGGPVSLPRVRPQRKPGTCAEGWVDVDDITAERAVAHKFRYIASNGQEYYVTDAHVTFGNRPRESAGRMRLVAANPGVRGNLADGTRLVLVSPQAGVASWLVLSHPLTGGTDDETDEEYAARFGVPKPDGRACEHGTVPTSAIDTLARSHGVRAGCGCVWDPHRGPRGKFVAPMSSLADD